MNISITSTINIG